MRTKNLYQVHLPKFSLILVLALINPKEHLFYPKIKLNNQPLAQRVTSIILFEPPCIHLNW